MVSVRKIVGFYERQEDLAKLAEGIKENLGLKRAILEEAKRMDIDPGELDASVKISKRKGAAEKLANRAIRAALGEIDPLVNFALAFDLNGIIDRIVPHKEVARRIKGFINAVQGRGNIAEIDLSEASEREGRVA